jgi:signal peptidase I
MKVILEYRRKKKEIKKLKTNLRKLSWILKKRNNLPPQLKTKGQNLHNELTEALSNIKKAESKDLKILNQRAQEALSGELKKYCQNWLAELFDELWLVVSVALILKFFVIGSFRVPTGSMVETIEIGDNLFVSMFAYGLTIPFGETQFVQFSDPERGDVVTFVEPNPEKKALVKRVVGVPGDKIKLHGSDLYINGSLVKKKFLKKRKYTSSTGIEILASLYEETLPGGVKHKILEMDNVDEERLESQSIRCRKYCGVEFTVPERKYFVLGDNRDNSYDSRYWGFLERDRIQGTPWMVWFSVQFGSSIFDVVDFRPERFGTIIR